MLKATMDINGRKTLTIGLSFGNLDKFRAAPRDSFIKIDGKAMDLPIDVMIFSGETEAHLAQFIMKSVGPDTIIHIDAKLKS